MEGGEGGEVADRGGEVGGGLRRGFRRRVRKAHLKRRRNAKRGAAFVEVGAFVSEDAGGGVFVIRGQTSPLGGDGCGRGWATGQGSPWGAIGGGLTLAAWAGVRDGDGWRRMRRLPLDGQGLAVLLCGDPPPFQRQASAKALSRGCRGRRRPPRRVPIHEGGFALAPLHRQRPQECGCGAW